MGCSSYYLRSRFYKAEIGRFIQRDTYVGNQNDPLSLNRYTYCQNEPLMYHDPVGMAPAPVFVPIRTWGNTIGAKVIFDNKTKKTTIIMPDGFKWVYNGKVYNNTVSINIADPKVLDMYMKHGKLKPSVVAKKNTQIGPRKNLEPKRDTLKQGEVYAKDWADGMNGWAEYDKKTGLVKIITEYGTAYYRGRMGVNNRFIIKPSDSNSLDKYVPTVPKEEKGLTAEEQVLSAGTGAALTGVDIIHKFGYDVLTKGSSGAAVRLGGYTAGSGFSYVFGLASDYNKYEGDDLTKAMGVTTAATVGTVASSAKLSNLVGSLGATTWVAVPLVGIGTISAGLLFNLWGDSWKEDNLTPKK